MSSGNIIGAINTPSPNSASGVWDLREQLWNSREGRWPLVVPTSPVTDGLLIQLDAGQSGSYPGTGSTWTDLQGTNNGTLVGNVSYTSLNGGGLVFDGSDDYVSLGSINTNLANNTFVFQVSVSSARTHTLIAGSATGYYQIRLLPTNEVQLVDSNTADMGTFTGFTASIDTPHNITVTRDGSTYSLYADGVYISQLTSGASFVTTSPRLGANVLLEELQGTMYCMYFYNRTLSAAEVFQNYSFINSRF
jgi:hypothetical protein